MPALSVKKADNFPVVEATIMTTSSTEQQTALLHRLYDMKQNQLSRANKQSDSLLYRVLEAEAQAISDALKGLR